MISIKKLIPHRRKIIPFDSLLQAVSELHSRTKTALKLLKKHRPARWIKDNRPWIFLLGKPRSGKTSLVAHSSMNFISPHLSSLEQSSEIKHIDWWFNNEAIIIDPAGVFSSAPTTDKEKQTLWHYFLDLIKTKPKSAPYSSLIMIIDACDLLNSEAEPGELAEMINRWINTFASLKKSWPISFIITKCDKLNGFSDYFSELDSEERKQLLGFSLRQQAENSRHQTPFKERGAEFMNRLNGQLLQRLHHEPNQSRRAQIVNFTFQMEKLIDHFEKLLSELPAHPGFIFKDVFFTSSLQTGNKISLLRPSLLHSLKLLNPLKPTTVRQKEYFTTQLFDQLVSHRPLRPSRGKIAYRLCTYFLALAILIGGFFTLHHAYRQNASAIRLAENDLSTLSTNTSWLLQLDTLQKTLSDLQHHGVSHHRWLGFGELGSVNAQLQNNYDALLRTNFALYLNNVLSEKISENRQHDQAALYNSLYTYLMLSKPDHQNSRHIKAWFSQFWKNAYPNNPNIQQELKQYLRDLLALPSLHWPTNHALILNAQHELQGQPLQDTAFKVLESQYRQDPTKPISLEGNAYLNTSSAMIPALYTEQNFDLIYNKIIPALAQKISRGNWVIGSFDNSTLTTAQTQSLVTQLRSLYVNQYLNANLIAISHITLTKTTNLNDIQSQIQLLATPDSPLWKVLLQFIDNPHIIDHLNHHDLTSSQLLGLVQFLQKNSDFQSFQQNLQTLQIYVNKMENDPSPIKAAYDNSVLRMSNNDKNDPIKQLISLSKQLPEPINQWSATLAQNLWKIMLQNSQQYVNSLWVTDIIPEYQSHILNRYPIFKDAKSDIAAQDFNRFFGPGGTIESFFNYYLKPFVDTSQAYWTWKQYEGEKIPIAQPTLDMITRASMIQKMFYSDDPSTPTVQFELTPISLSPNVRRFTLNIGGQLLTYKRNSKQGMQATWPGPEGNLITLQFKALQPSNDMASFSGPWAWLHLIDAAAIQPTSNPKVFQIRFDLDGHQAQYQLTADNSINPYQIGLLEAFRCPGSL